jgi:hypothetical protein
MEFQGPNPVLEVSQDDDSEGWIVVTLGNMRKPSAECMETIRQGFFKLDNQRLQPGLWEDDPHRPAWFFHGTSIPSFMSILKAGTILSSGTHVPDGVYAFGLQARSNSSSYVTYGGCQICFRSPGLVMSMNNSGLFRACPPGVILRTWRSSVKRFGAQGREWIHNSDSIEIVGARLQPHAVMAWLQEHHAQLIVGLQFPAAQQVLF